METVSLTPAAPNLGGPRSGFLALTPELQGQTYTNRYQVGDTNMFSYDIAVDHVLLYSIAGLEYT